MRALGLSLVSYLRLVFPERVLVIDGGSTDGTVDVAMRYGVRVI